MTSSLNDAIESVNQDQNLTYHIAKSTVHQYELIANRTISLIVFLFEFARQQSHESSTFIYLFARQLLQQLHEYHIHYSSRKILKYTRLQVK